MRGTPWRHQNTEVRVAATMAGIMVPKRQVQHSAGTVSMACMMAMGWLMA